MKNKIYKFNGYLVALFIGLFIYTNIAWGGVITECTFNDVRSVGMNNQPDGKSFMYPPFAVEYKAPVGTGGKVETKVSRVTITRPFTSINLKVLFGTERSEADTKFDDKIFAYYWLNQDDSSFNNNGVFTGLTVDPNTPEAKNAVALKKQTKQSFGTIVRLPNSLFAVAGTTEAFISRVRGVGDNITWNILLDQNRTDHERPWKISGNFFRDGGGTVSVEGLGTCDEPVTTPAKISQSLMDRYGPPSVKEESDDNEPR